MKNTTKIFILFFALLSFSSLSQAFHCTQGHSKNHPQVQENHPKVLNQTTTLELLNQQAKKCLTEKKNSNKCCASLDNLKVCCSKETDSSSINCQTED